VSHSCSFAGSIRVRRCDEVKEIIQQIRDVCGVEFEIDAVEIGDVELGVVIDGYAELTTFGVMELDLLLQQLGPFALEAAKLVGQYDLSPCELIVAPEGAAGKAAISRLRLDEIEPLIGSLVAEDRATLIDLLSRPPQRV
jgi:hypothetical protein